MRVKRRDFELVQTSIVLSNKEAISSLRFAKIPRSAAPSAFSVPCSLLILSRVNGFNVEFNFPPKAEEYNHQYTNML
jgi:hypothetical protein